MTDFFETWLLLPHLTVGALLQCWDSSAVYALRDATTKDILKFGSTRRLGQRILHDYIAGVGGDTTKRIHRALFANETIERVELAWLVTKDQEEARRKETEFRNVYKKAHGQRPAWDRQG